MIVCMAMELSIHWHVATCCIVIIIMTIDVLRRNVLSDSCRTCNCSTVTSTAHRNNCVTVIVQLDTVLAVCCKDRLYNSG